jgi:outer membrane protein assembly factor BamB
LRQAIAADDPAAVQALTTQFYGTSASTDAQIWLGDRALAQGDFNAAESSYQAAANDLAPEDRPRVAARLRLAGAMLGRDEGEPVTEPVQLGETTLRPSEFEKLVTQMLTRNATTIGNRRATQQLQWEPPTSVPLAKTYTLQKLAAIENPAGRDPNSALRDVDWVGAQIGATFAPPQMLINTRSDLSAYDLVSGQRVWTYSAGGESAKATQWAMVPMHPLAAGNKVFARRLLSTGPELICVVDGKLLWRSPKNELVASDPCLLGDRLLAVTFAPAQQEMLQLSLTTFDLASGKIVSQQPLSQFRDNIQRELACQLTAVGEQLIVVGGGCVISCDSVGQPQWLRRETWIAGVIVDPRTSTQRYDVPLVHDKLLYVAQPGVPGIACLDLRTGRLQWQQAFANLVRMVGLADDKLVVQTTDGFLGLDSSKGTFAWHHDADDVLEGVALGSDGRLFYGRRGPLAPKPVGAELFWLDAANGQPVAKSSIAGWQPEQPAFGPLVGEKDRWHVLAGGSKRPPTREIFQMKATGDAEQPAH